MTKTRQYTFICSKCGTKRKVEVNGLWQPHRAVMPEGWSRRMVGAVERSFCPNCTRDEALPVEHTRGRAKLFKS